MLPCTSRISRLPPAAPANWPVTCRTSRLPPTVNSMLPLTSRRLPLPPAPKQRRSRVLTATKLPSTWRASTAYTSLKVKLPLTRSTHSAPCRLRTVAFLRTRSSRTVAPNGTRTVVSQSARMCPTEFCTSILSSRSSAPVTSMSWRTQPSILRWPLTSNDNSGFSPTGKVSWRIIFLSSLLL